jgi:hypothetical protein
MSGSAHHEKIVGKSFGKKLNEITLVLVLEAPT